MKYRADLVSSQSAGSIPVEKRTRALVALRRPALDGESSGVRLEQTDTGLTVAMHMVCDVEMAVEEFRSTALHSASVSDPEVACSMKN